MNAILTDIFAPFPSLQIKRGQEPVYKRLRIQAPRLVSYLDDHDKTDTQQNDFIVAFGYNKQLGTVSLVSDINPKRKGVRKLFSRIDLVITDKSYRGMGVGRFLILSALLHLLKHYRAQIYSISCLAAHAAISHVLESLDFKGTLWQDRNFKHESLYLDKKTIEHHTGIYVKKSIESAQSLNYHLRLIRDNL